MPRATLPGWTGAATRRLCGTSGFQGSPIQAAPLTKRPQLQAAGIVWHAAASDYASLLPMTATLHSGRVGVKQFASQAIEPIGGGGPGGGAWTAETAGRRGVRVGEALCWHRALIRSLHPGRPLESASVRSGFRVHGAEHNVGADELGSHGHRLQNAVAGYPDWLRKRE